jgi:hypothetical protein
MTQLEPRVPTGAPLPSDGGGPSSPRREPGFNWRISVGMFVGLAILFGVLFGLRALHIFPPEPGQDAEIAAARATQAALGTQEALAPQPTVAVAGVPQVAPTMAAATSAAQVRPAATPATAQQLAPAAAPELQTPVPITVPTTQPVIAATPAPTLEATTAPTVQSNPTEVQAAPTPVQANLPADQAAAIVQGYSNYWTVRVNALHDPDPANPDLESVMVGTELSRAQQLLSGYQQQGTAYQSDVKHQIWITQASPDIATVVDRYVATSVKVQPTSLEPVTPGSAPNVERLTTTFSLQNIGGTWKVVDQRGGG